MPSCPLRVALCCPLVLLLISLAPALADELPSAPALQASPATPATGPLLSDTEREAQAFLNDLRLQRNTEIEAALASGQLRVEALQSELLASKLPGEQMALQRAVELAKQDTQIELLRIQAHYAELAGYPERALEIRAEIDQMLEARASRKE